jgi:hypothetical protein
MAMEFHEFDPPLPVFVVVGPACQDGAHDRCAGISFSDEGEPWICGGRVLLPAVKASDEGDNA